MSEITDEQLEVLKVSIQKFLIEPLF